MNNWSKSDNSFYFLIKLFVIPSRTQFIREGLCDPWLFDRGSTSGKISSEIKLRLRDKIIL